MLFIKFQIRIYYIKKLHFLNTSFKSFFVLVSQNFGYEKLKFKWVDLNEYNIYSKSVYFSLNKLS